MVKADKYKQLFELPSTINPDSTLMLPISLPPIPPLLPTGPVNTTTHTTPIHPLTHPSTHPPTTLSPLPIPPPSPSSKSTNLSPPQIRSQASTRRRENLRQILRLRLHRPINHRPIPIRTPRERPGRLLVGGGLFGPGGIVFDSVAPFCGAVAPFHHITLALEHFTPSMIPKRRGRRRRKGKGGRGKQQQLTPTARSKTTLSPDHGSPSPTSHAPAPSRTSGFARSLWYPSVGVSRSGCTERGGRRLRRPGR